ncbi:telomere-associated protein Tap [Streptomyces megasporus]|uniref:telomere-associated protein Tap n=1 Tax=Streptomyces megasporus TaxID=44060 RepID=UPI0004E22E85|nr:helix-turn-helix transcriptional regulator [Streptomyces megasporus]
MPNERDELMAAVDALLARPKELPPPAERKRLRTAAGVTRSELAEVFGVRRETVAGWEAGRSDPRPPKREAYARLLEGWAAKYPAEEEEPVPARAAGPVGVPVAGSVAGPVVESAASVPPVEPAAPAVPAVAEADRAGGGELVTGEPLPCVLCGRPTPYRAAGRPQHIGGFCRTVPTAPPAPPAPAAPTVPVSVSAPAPVAVSAPASPPARTTAPAPRRPVVKPPARRAPAPASAPPAPDSRFPSGPLAVLDGEGTAHLADGRTLHCPARTVPELAEWALNDAGLGAPRLHRSGRDADPLVVLTGDAAERLGLPVELTDRRGLRLPDSHPAVRGLTKAGWRLTRRGFGPWARVHRPAQAGRRLCVQFAVLPWGALDSRSWGDAADFPPAELARTLGDYAARVLTPCGSTAVCGLELMTAVRPPTRAVRDETGGAWVSAPVPGSLTTPVDPAPPEAPDEHPVAAGRAATDVLDEEAYEWLRDPELVADDERARPWAVGIDVNTAFLAAASRLTVGLGPAVHVTAPDFDGKLPGCWLVDLSHVDLDPRLPSPFTPHGGRPRGPAWYATPTVAYAVELGAEVRPVEAWVRPDRGPYLDPWHARLRAAYLETMAALGVTADLDEAAYLAAMESHKDTDRRQAAVLSAVKATVKGGIGKLRERPQGLGYRPGERWPALERPTWRPDIRAAVIATARVNMHRKMVRTAATAGLYPLAVLSDCVVYPGDGPSPLDVLPRAEDGRPAPGTFRLGVSPGMVKHEGTRPLAWALELMEAGHNPARHIKDGVDAVAEGE